MNQEGDASPKIFTCSGFIEGLEPYLVEQLRISEAVARKCSVKNELLNIIKKETPTQAFPCEFWEIFKNTFLLIEHFWWLFLEYLVRVFTVFVLSVLKGSGDKHFCKKKITLTSTPYGNLAWSSIINFSKTTHNWCTWICMKIDYNLVNTKIFYYTFV